MIVWSGWGILVPVVAVLIFGLSVTVTSVTGIPNPLAAGVGFAAGGVLSGLALFFIARSLDGREGRVLLDEKTGQRVTLRPTAGSFFFVPTRYWAFICPVVGVAIGLWLGLGPT